MVFVKSGEKSQRFNVINLESRSKRYKYAFIICFILNILLTLTTIYRIPVVYNKTIEIARTIFGV